MKLSWILFAAPVLAASVVAAPTDGKPERSDLLPERSDLLPERSDLVPVRSYLLSGETLIYPRSANGLPRDLAITRRGASTAARQVLAIRSRADVAITGERVSEFTSDALFEDGAPLAIERAGEAPLDIGSLELVRSDEDGWTMYATSEALAGRPVLQITTESLAVQALGADQLLISGELALHPAMAAELGLSPRETITVGALTLLAGSYPGLLPSVPLRAPRWLSLSGRGGIAPQVAGPDVIVSGIGNGLMKYGTVGSITGYSVTTTSCNIGTLLAQWFASLPNHPVIGTQFYKFKTVAGTTRFEQIGMSWLKHGFCAADSGSCPGGTNVPEGTCDWLGLFSTDTYNASLNGTQAFLSSRSEVQPFTGTYPYPPILNWNTTGDAIYKRVQVQNSEIDPSLNAGSRFFGEVVYITTDEPAANRYNNCSYREIFLGNGTETPPGSNLTFTGPTFSQHAAIEAWPTIDTGVALTNVDVPGDGRLILGSKVTDLGGGHWHYEYALFNMNCDAGVRSFGVPAAASVNAASFGFHDIDYHSGDPYDGTDWPAARNASSIDWETARYAANANANALRWNTLYNFRFDADAPPATGSITLGLFKTDGAVTVSAPVPAGAPTGVDVCQPGVGVVQACPCGNAPANAPRGCDNSSATGGARLASSGSASLAADGVVFTTDGEKPVATSIVSQGDALLASGVTFGQGVRCADGLLVRLYVKTAVAGAITAPGPGDARVSARSAALGDAIAPGASRWYCVYYRDPIVLGACPAASTFNVTQTQRVTWSP